MLYHHDDVLHVKIKNNPSIIDKTKAIQAIILE
jgi:hypothetical protein